MHQPQNPNGIPLTQRPPAPAPSDVRTTQRCVSVPRFAVLLVAVIALGMGTHFLHAYQVRRHAGGLLEEAKSAEAAGRTDEAEQFLRDYVGLAPRDAEGWARYGRLLAHKPSPTGRDLLAALGAMDKAVIHDSTRNDVRLEAAVLAVRLRVYRKAEDHLKALKDMGEEDAEVASLLGQCEEGLGRYADAAASYGTAARHGRTLDYLRRARVLRLLDDAGASAAGTTVHDARERANEAVERMIRVAPKDMEARREAVRYYLRVAAGESHPDEARKYIKQARKHIDLAMGKLHADRDSDFLLAAEAARADGQLEASKQFIERGLQCHPDSPALLHARARTAVAEADLKTAIRCARQSYEHLPKSTEERAELAELLMDLGLVPEARTVVERLPEEGRTAATVPYLRAYLAYCEGQWVKARTSLEGVREAAVRSPRWLARIDLLLARCWAQLGNADQQLACARRAQGNDPLLSSVAGREQAAALAKLNKPDEALQVLQAIRPLPPDLQLTLAQLLFERNQQLPVDKRHWEQVTDTLAKLPPAQRQAPAVRLLEVSVLAARGQVTDAKAVLDQEATRHPKDPTWPIALARLAEQQRQMDAARKLLEDTGDRLGRSLAWQQAWVGYWVRQGSDKARRDEARRQIRKLEAALDATDKASRHQLVRLLAEAEGQLGDAAAAARLWKRAAEQDPQDLDARFRLFQRALATGDEAGMDRYLDELARLEGPGGALTSYAAAARLLDRARKDDKDDRNVLEEARRHAAAAVASRPSWAAAAVLAAQVEDLAGNQQQALDKYQQALKLGERRIFVIQRTVSLLWQSNRPAEALSLLTNLPSEAMELPALGRSFAELSLIVNRQQPSNPQANVDKAYKAALATVNPKSMEYRDHLWLGTIALAAGKEPEAEKSLQKAVDLAPKQPELWVALVYCQHRRDPRKAEATVETAGKAVPAEKHDLTLALCWEAAGRADRATQWFKAAIQKTPGDVTVLEPAAWFYLRNGARADAESAFRRILEPKAEATPAVAAWARRNLAMLLARRGSYAEYRTALSLLDENGQAGAAAVDDRRARAHVLAGHPGTRAAAVTVLEQLDKEKALQPADRLLLAGLYAAAGAANKADEQYLTLLDVPNPQPAWLTAYADFLIRRDNGDNAAAAERCVAALVKSAPELPTTVGLRAGLLHARAQNEKRPELDDQAEQVVRAFVKEYPTTQAQMAGLLENLGRTGAAEVLFRTAANRPDDIGATLRLAGFLGRQHRTKEALDLCEQVWRTKPSKLVAAVGLEVLSGSDPQLLAKHAGRVEGWLNKLPPRPGSGGLAVLKGQLREMLKDYPGAAHYYEHALVQDKNNVVALNNLAWYLAFRGQAERAVGLVDRAVERSGPVAELLDTRAVALLTLGEGNRAVRDMEQAIQQAPTNAVYHFHLARAAAAAGNLDKARTELHQASKLGLRKELLHPLEQGAYPTFVAGLNSR